MLEAGREDIKKKWRPKEEYLKQQNQRRNQRDDTRDKTCQACGYSNREIHRMLGELHTCDAKECFFRGTKFLNDKELRERVNQYNL